MKKYFLIFPDIFFKATFLLILFLVWLPAAETELYDFFKTRKYNLEVEGNREIYVKENPEAGKLVFEFQPFNKLFQAGKYVYFFENLPVWKNNRIHLSSEDAKFLTKVVDYFEKKIGDDENFDQTENTPAVSNKALSSEKTSPPSPVESPPPKKEEKQEKQEQHDPGDNIPTAVKLSAEEKEEISETSIDDLYTSSTSQKIDYVFLDAGHGGRDPGAIFYGFLEKDLTLSLAKELAEILQEEKADFKVILTRHDDTYLSLEQRCSIANQTVKANENGIFISIHLNIWIDPQVRGIEAYYLTGDENVLQKKIYRHLEDLSPGPQGYFKKIFGYLKVIQYQLESRYLSYQIIKNIQSNVKASVPRGYKDETFYVLKGVLMPAILLELGFISNRKDMELISDKDKRRKVLKQIGSAVMDYTKDFKKSNGFKDNFYLDQFLSLDRIK